MGSWIPDSINLAQNINFAIKSNVVKNFLSNNNISFVASSEKSITVISLEDLHAKVEDFTVPVLYFKNKGYILLEVMKEIRIETLWQ